MYIIYSDSIHKLSTVNQILFAPEIFCNLRFVKIFKTQIFSGDDQIHKCFLYFFFKIHLHGLFKKY